MDKKQGKFSSKRPSYKAKKGHSEIIDIPLKKKLITRARRQKN